MCAQNMNMKAVYPGSFDPVTNGHIDLIQRSSTLFDQVIVAILQNAEKKPLFTVRERIAMLEEATSGLKNIAVTSFHGLLVDYVEQMEAGVIIRGIRAVSDYEYELQMALMNRRLSSKVETVFMLPAESYSFLSSKLVREVAALGGAVSGFVPAGVERRLSVKFGTK
jgi:pantetheine-phosphate adenylyltransferase